MLICRDSSLGATLPPDTGRQTDEGDSAEARRAETTAPPPSSDPDIAPAATASTLGDALVTIASASPLASDEHVSSEYLFFCIGCATALLMGVAPESIVN